MGFTTGLLGGATLTYSLLYLTLYIHQANRKAQHTLLSQSSIHLNSVVEPLPPTPEPPAYEIRRAGLVESAKDRWNSAIENTVRELQETDWNKQRELYERRIANAWGRLRQTEGMQDVEKKVKEVGSEVRDRVESGAATAKEEIVKKTGELRDKVESGAITAKDEAVKKAGELRERVESGAVTAKDEIVKKAGELREKVESGAVTAKDEAMKKAGELKEGVKDAVGKGVAATDEMVKNAGVTAAPETRQLRLLEMKQ